MSEKLPDMSKPIGDAQEEILTYFNGESRTVYDTGVEHPFPDGKLIVSRTDLEGNLTLVNDAFVAISGYSEEELLGKPHCILRHPDMPKAAFADLWATVKAGKKWHGYVKNLCKDGGYYWVYATVVPNVRKGEVVGYTSVRRKPSRAKVAQISDEYAKMKAGE